MPAVEQARAFGDAEALGAIERALHGKLRAHRLSEAFIDRHREDAVQQGLAEYGRALARGGEIDNPGAWVVKRAYLRAIDELRREERLETGEEALAEGERRRPDLFSPTESEAIGNVEVVRLRAAIEKLSAEQRQALGLYYFEELPTREAAKALGCGQTTFRRRLDSALRVLRQRFGIAVPAPGEELAIEVGLAAWLSLSGARVVPTRGPIDQFLAAADAMRSAVEGLVGRSRDLTARLLASGGGEGVGAAAGGPLGKAAGSVCAGALTACALTGVIGPGVGSFDLVGQHDSPQAAKTARSGATRRRPALATPKAPEAPPSRTTDSKSPTSQGPSRHHVSARVRRQRREARQVRKQTDGFARAASESTGSGSGSAAVSASGASEPTEASATSGSSGGSSGQHAAEEEQARQQFDPFK